MQNINAEPVKTGCSAYLLSEDNISLESSSRMSSVFNFNTHHTRLNILLYNLRPLFPIVLPLIVSALESDPQAAAEYLN